MVTVSLSTSVGECMELMRMHSIRHLPVMATQAGEDKNQAINEEEETMANATDSRNADNRAFKAAVKADTDSVMLVTKAIEALSKFYSLRQVIAMRTTAAFAVFLPNCRTSPYFATSCRWLAAY